MKKSNFTAGSILVQGNEFSSIARLRNQLYEKLLLSVWVVLSVYLLINVFTKSMLAIITLSLGICVLNPLCWWLYKRGQETASKILFIFCVNFHTFWTCIAYSDKAFAEFYFFISPVVTLVLFDLKRKKILMFGSVLPFVAWVLKKFVNLDGFPNGWIVLNPDINFFYNFNFAGTFLLLILFLRWHILFMIGSSEVAQKEILDNNSFLKAVLHNVPSMIFVKEAKNELRFSLMNHAGEKLIGLPESGFIGKSDSDFFPPDQAEFFRQKDLAVFAGKKVLKIDQEEILTSQGPRFLRTLKVPTYDSLGAPQWLIGISNDITEDIENQNLLMIERARTMQNSKLALLGEMAAGVAHEINNPLAIIDGSLNVLAREQDNSEKIVERLEVMRKAVKRISKIVIGLKRFTHQSDGQTCTRVLVTSILQEVVSFSDGNAARFGVKIDLLEQQELFVLVNELEISQVLINLVANAIDAIKNLPEKWIKISSHAENGRVIIRVCDSGLGIAAEVQEKMFNPFFTTKRVGEGTGLGLSISKGIVEAHGGELRLSKVISNTCFEVVLPLVQI